MLNIIAFLVSLAAAMAMKLDGRPYWWTMLLLAAVQVPFLLSYITS